MKCQSRIVKTYKTAKAESMWPVSIYGPNPAIDQYPEVCDGDVTVRVIIEHDGDCACCGTTALAVTFTCTRCQQPYVPGRLELDDYVRSLRVVDKGLDLVEALAILTPKGDPR